MDDNHIQLPESGDAAAMAGKSDAARLSAPPTDREYLRKLKSSEQAILALLSTEEQPVIRKVFARGRKEKRLDTPSLMAAIEELDLDPERCDRVYDILEGLGIEAAGQLAWSSDENQEEEQEAQASSDQTDSPDVSEEEREKRAEDTASATSIQLYLRDIRRYELLSQEGEVDLFRIIEKSVKAMDELKDLRLDGIYSGPEYDRLLVIIHEGNRARDQVVKANLRLVVSIAKHFSCPGMQFMDLIQEGNVGLIKAVEGFDYTLGYRFASYASWWIRESILRAMANSGRMIRIPSNVRTEMNRIAKVTRSMSMTLGREPTPEELASLLDMSRDRVIRIMQASKDTLSLDLPMGEDGDASFGDRIGDTSVEPPEDAVIASGMRDHVDELLLTLSLKEEEILRCRFGIDEEVVRSYEEIGEDLGMSPERVRQLEAKALRKLRDPELSGKLRDFL